MIVNKIPIQAILHHSTFNLDKVKYNLKPRKCGANEPIKALWTSKFQTPIENIEWVKYCLSHKNYRKGSHTCLWKLYPKEEFDLKVYQIDTIEDYENPLLSKIENDQEIKDLYPIDSKMINYEEMFNLGYHGIWFTENMTRLKYENFSEKLGNIPLMMTSKLADSIVWFTTDWIGKIELTTDKVFE